MEEGDKVYVQFGDEISNKEVKGEVKAISERLGIAFIKCDGRICVVDLEEQEDDIEERKE